jgi:DNA-binding NarL/FixJ family response regulator
MAKVVLCDDHELMIEGQRCIVERLGHTVEGVVSNGRDLVDFVKTHPVDLVVVDISMPVMNGLDALVSIREAAPAVRCIVMTMYEDPIRVTRAFHYGAKGYVSKREPAEEFEQAIRAVLAGKAFLSKELGPEVVQECSKAMHAADVYVGSRKLSTRERQVLQLYGEGKTDKEIAAILAITVSTVRYHHDRICRAFNCRSNADLVRLAIREGLVEL